MLRCKCVSPGTRIQHLQHGCARLQESNTLTFSHSQWHTFLFRRRAARNIIRHGHAVTVETPVCGNHRSPRAPAPAFLDLESNQQRKRDIGGNPRPTPLQSPRTTRNTHFQQYIRSLRPDLTSATGANQHGLRSGRPRTGP